MADFADLQKKFDTDADLRRRLFTDPVAVLDEQGVKLTPQQAFRLQQDVEEFRRASGGVHPDLSIDIGVSIRPIGVHVHIHT